MDDAARREGIGKDLYAAGWRQGTIFHPGRVELDFLAQQEASGSSSLRKRPLAEGERLILISQDCDIVAKTSTEPLVEVLLCYVEDSDSRRSNIERNSARAFVVDPSAKLVADARHRMQLEKTMLAHFTPEPWSSDARRFRRFVTWLGRRYTRPAVPDEVFETFQRPVDEVIRRLRRSDPDIITAFTSAVYETRVSFPDDIQLPFDLHVIMMIRGDGLTEEQFDALALVEQSTRDKLDSTRVHLAPFEFRTDDEMSLAEYLATVSLFFDYLTYHGDEVLGLEPPPPA